ncbi:MAG: cobyrinate a,c-diamide synthase [Cyanobacteriota bacterium]|nr:cobyrinate a,c-diamide synthase [Cyanobacteriota bacterium]
MSVLIAAPCSGSGKTLLSLCLTALARRRGATIQTFKVGPDYLDPQLLAAVAGRPCRNLDTLLCGSDWVRRSFAWHGSRADRVLVEGVMGLFDGLGPGSEASSAAVAALLDLPVVLVVEASRQAGSLAALVRGFRDHGPPAVRLAGVVLNRVASERHDRLLREALAAIEVPVLGVLPPAPALELPSRHLGLHSPGEIADLPERCCSWADLAERHLDLPRLWPLLAPQNAAAGGDPITLGLGLAPVAASVPPTVAIASDAAFHFRYPEAQEVLVAAGLRPVPWSPLADQPLPPHSAAVLLPGGYPELHGAALAASHRSLEALRQAARRGVPIVAECGGLLLLGHSLRDAQGGEHALAGVLPLRAAPGRLSLGYRQATALADGVLLRRGERLWGHEFHRWQIEGCGEGQLWHLEGWGVPARAEGWSRPRLHASWLHLHWAGQPAMVRRLAAAAALCQREQEHREAPHR